MKSSSSSKQQENSFEPTIDQLLRSTWQAVSKMYNEEAGKYGATMAVAFALLSIDRNGTPSTALGPKMGMESTSLSRTLKNMEDRGLIFRKRNPEDGRGVLIFLTPFGVEMRNLSKEKVVQFNTVLASKISAKKLQHFREVTDVITQLIKDKEIFIEPENDSK